MTCIHPSVDNKNRPKMEEISQGANVVNVVQNEDSVLICFFFVCVLPSTPISPRIQLKSSKWNWLMRVECLGKEGRRLCPAWAEDTEGRSQLWKQEELGVKGNSGEGSCALLGSNSSKSKAMMTSFIKQVRTSPSAFFVPGICSLSRY